jgi:hypothetical protein
MIAPRSSRYVIVAEFGIFYIAMALAGYAVELSFGALGIIPTSRAVPVLEIVAESGAA